jgi:hypothetical protein
MLSSSNASTTRYATKVQRLRSVLKSLQSRKCECPTVATELAHELIDCKASVMPFPLQDAKGGQTARDVMPLRPLGACLTAAQAELSLTHANNLFNLGADAVQAADLRWKQCQAVGGIVLFAVSDNQNFEPSAQPADLGPVGMPPMLTDRMAVKPAVLLQTTDEIPPVVPNPFQ